MRTRLISSISAVLLGFGTVVAVTPVAAADSSCGAGHTCVWEDSWYRKGVIRFQRYIPDFSLWTFDNGRRANDEISSVWNNGNYEDSCLFEHRNGGGEARRITRGTWVDDLRSRSFNDRASSAYFTGYRSC